ncbi:MAG: SAM-dependent chlorinase/fluorinase [Bacteroidota bacterium]
MQLVTLISDWNSSDYYIGAIKGRILSSCPTVTIVDVNHQIASYNITQAAFVVKNTYKNFPKGTIHILSINSETCKEKPHVIVKYDGHYFIGTDNGMFHLFIERETELIVEIDSEKDNSSFPELSIFSKIACEIINNSDIAKLGVEKKSLFKQLPVLPAIEESLIIGKVIYIDSFNNVISNVTKELFEKVQKNRRFDIYVQSKSNRISKINKKYNETSEGELLAIFNSTGYLEIAIRNGKAAQLFNLTTNSSIRIVFNDSKNSENDLQGRLF